MENKIKRTLKKWESSLINYGKIDQWRIDEDYSILGYFIASKKSNVAKNSVRDCRDLAIFGHTNTVFIVSLTVGYSTL